MIVSVAPLIIGDCHTMLFRAVCESPLQVAHVGPITADAFCRPLSPMRKQFDAILADAGGVAGRVVVLSISEIDIRAHFWRDAPVLLARGMPVEKYLQHRVTVLLDALETFRATARPSQIILWGPPASLLGQAPHNDEFPTAGSNRTRNILTHIYHRLLADTIVKADLKISLASMFYDMLNPDFSSNESWIPDAIHIPAEKASDCFQRLSLAMKGLRISLGPVASRVTWERAALCLEQYEPPAPDSPRQFYKNWFAVSEGQGTVNIMGTPLVFASDASIDRSLPDVAVLGFERTPFLAADD